MTITESCRLGSLQGMKVYSTGDSQDRHVQGGGTASSESLLAGGEALQDLRVAQDIIW